MSEGSAADDVIVGIHVMLKDLPSTTTKPSIHRVDSRLRIGRGDHIYNPQLVSIGPYHHGNSRLQKMDRLKTIYLQRFLERKDEQVDRYVAAVAAMEERARKCYAEHIEHKKNEFVTLLVLDGIFIIELFRCFRFKNLRDEDDYIFSYESVLSQVRQDILLLENQVPFFVLNQLFNMTKTNENTIPDADDDLIKLALGFFDGIFVKNMSVSRVWERLPVKNIDHLFGLVHDSWCLSFAENISSQSHGCNVSYINWDNINSVSGLREAGIKFRKVKGNKNFMDIKFMNGVLRMPQLSIFGETESQLRNLVEYEQYFPDGEQRYVSDYTFFMHCLINNSNDVEFLRSRGIIENCLGPDEEVCQMFNRLGRNILISSNFCYSQVFCNVNRQCCRRVKRWKANLKRNYFNSPWSIIKFLAAVALLILTFTQTTYTILTYYHRSK